MQTLSALFGIFLLSSFLAIYITSFFYKTRLLKLGVFGFSVALLIGLIYSFVLVGDYGAMDRGIFQKLDFINPDLRFEKYLYFSISAIFSILLVLVLFKKLAVIFKIVLITLVLLTTANAGKIALSSGEAPTDSTKPYLYENELFSYSKDGKNIVVLVLDMFSGSHTPYLLEQFPQFKDALDGFVLFDNALSTTNSTIHSVATLIGGEYYATYNMNARGDNLKETIDSAFISTSRAFSEGGFSVSLMPVVGSNARNIMKKADIYALDANSYQFYGYYVHQQKLADDINEIRSSAKHFEIAQLMSYGLFRFSPEPYFRPRIYKDGVWLLDVDATTHGVLQAISFASSFYAPTHILKADSNKPTFKYFHSMMTHLPYGAYFHDNKCEFFNPKTAWDDYPHKVEMDYHDSQALKSAYHQHFDTEACALQYLANYVESLKNLGIYDQTQIFIVSDHSAFDSIGLPRINDARPDVLFLFKDFNAKGAMKRDSKLMANYDIASIFCENLPNGCPNVAPNILKNYPQNREIIYTIPAYWELHKHHKNEWILNSAYLVKDSIFESQNWQEIKLNQQFYEGIKARFRK